MHLAKLYHSSAFRYALVYMALFSLSASGVLAFVYFMTVGVIVRQTNETIEAEISGLTEEYRELGLSGLRQIIEDRSGGNESGHVIYLLADPDLQPLAGNLLHWPEIGRGQSGWIDLPLGARESANQRPRTVRARALVLSGDFHLLVGRDMTGRERFQSVMTEAVFGALGVTVLLGLMGGFLMSRDLLRRLDAVNRSSREIIHGDFKQRMPVSGSGDEFDELSANLNAMLDQIQELMVGMRQVTDNIAHDLRSPISRMRSRLEIALVNKPDPETLREVVQETIEEADSILNTFNALLDIALAESGAPREQFERIDLGEIARDTAELYEPLAEVRKLRLCIQIGEGLLIAGNRHLISQALANVFDNAIKYTPASGVVALTAGRDSDGPSIIISDTGPGIPAEFRNVALSRFSRLDPSRETPGSGLGLSLVAAVAQLHGAKLRLEDNLPGLRVVLQFADSPER